MRRFTFIALTAVVGLSIPLAASAEVETWQIDKNHTQAHFKVKHLLVATVRGSFAGVKGTVSFDPKDMTTLQLDVTIDATTINTNNAKRDRHLKTADFFNIKKHPTIRFVSEKGGTKVDGDELEVTGKLTMNGVTKTVTLEIEDISKPVLNPAGWWAIAALAETKVNRHDYGISWNKSLDGGGVIVGDEVKIEIDIELLRKRDPKKSE